MKHGLLDDTPVAEVFDDDAFEQGGRDASVPDALGVDDDDRATGAHAEARGLTAFDALGAEEEAFALEQRGE